MQRLSPFFGILQAMLLVHSGLAAELPVREVVLFKHGVGYFQRSGDVKAGDTAQLDFKADEMNDVLKSLTVEERGGGKITGLRYDSSDTLENKRQKFPFVVGDNQPLSAFFDFLKGARVEVKTGDQSVSGVVLSGRNIVATNSAPERELLSILTDSGDIRTVDLASASAIRFADATQQALLKDYLSLLNQSRSKDKRSVYIDSTSSAARRLAASYMVPTAVWKSSYRLIFGTADQPTLEGWAIVDNTTGEDWNNVQLAVVSGRPVSFISRLYEPRYRTRPVSELAEEGYAAPMLFEGAMSKSVAGPAMLAAAAPPPAPEARGQMFRRAEASQMMEVSADRVDMASNIAATAQGRELGDLFEYRFATPVTVKKNESAMLPFLQQKVGARKLLIYTQSMGVNPMSAAEIINATGKTLDGGPITVYDTNAYSGEALVETIKSGDKRLISYATDLGTRITTAFDSSRDLVREVHLRRGILTTKNAMQETKTFTIRNVDPKAKTLIVEHAQRPGYTLLTMKATETTINSYRFEVKLSPNATDKFAVTEERVYDTSTSVSSLTNDVLVTYLQNKALSPEGKQQLEAIAAKKREVAATSNASNTAQNQINSLTNDQGRIRSNMESLNRVTGQQDQVQRYARQLATVEGQIATGRDTLSELSKKKAALDAELNNLIEKASF